MSEHEWTKHERDGWTVCARCGMVRNYDGRGTSCSGKLPKIDTRDAEWAADRMERERLDAAGALALLRRLDDGGRVVSTAGMTSAQIAIARAADRMWVDSRGYGYVYVPGTKGAE